MTGGAAFNEVFLDDVWVPDEDRLGPISRGWDIARTTLSLERSAIGNHEYGRVGLMSIDRYTEMVRAFGLADDPVVRQRLADLIIHLRVAKYAGIRASARRGLSTAAVDGPLTKLALSENYARIADFVSLVLGPSMIADTGAWGTFSWSTFVNGTPGIRLGGGTDEVMRNVIAERGLGLPRA
jgi:alkylation response protein AidB-like acyl-CoA dehydrogenase